MDPCVTCGTEETTPVCTCDCQCLETARKSGCREIKLLAPTRDTDTAWSENDPIVPEGVLCLVKDRLFDGSLEYFIGDGESKYSELTMLYAGAPLSRIGAENHSPLAASGKSTLDPSWLPDATSSTKGAVMTSTTGAAGKVPITASGSSTMDSSWLPDATDTTKGAVNASTTAGANQVVKADANGTLDGWGSAIAAAAGSSLADGKTIVANNDGTLTVNPTNATAAQKSTINSALADSNAGLSVNPTTGKLGVDFSAMPTDKFEALLKSLKMQIPLETNLDLYVDQVHAQAGDTIIDGRGTTTKPFRTISACVNFVTQTYALGSYDVTIHVSAGTYTENVTLPQFTRTSGSITIQANDFTQPPTVVSSSRVQSVFSATGGTWKLRRLNITGTFSDNGSGNAHYPGAVQASGGDTSVSIGGCTISVSFTGDAGQSTNELRTILADTKSIVTLTPIAGYQNSLSCDKGNSTASYMLYALRGGSIYLNRSNTVDDGIMYDIPCSGSVSVFCRVREQSIFTIAGSGNAPSFSGTVTGKKYQANSSSWIIAPNGGFPGDVAGTVDSDTYCWYS